LITIFTFLRNKKIALLGFGRSNRAVADILINSGIPFVICDKNENLDLSKYPNADRVLGPNYIENLSKFDLVFRTPAVPYFSDFLHNVKTCSEIELFFDVCPCKIIGVTGSDGKTTVSTLISKILRESGFTVYLGGNIGTPLISKALKIKPNDVVVAELSSFQLISIKKSPQIAVLTNISPNHLDIHKNFAEYTDAKQNIIKFQNENCTAVLNANDKIVSKWRSKGNNLLFGTTGVCDIMLNGDIIEFVGTPIINRNEIKIPGIHNVKNFMTAIGAVSAVKLDIEAIQRVAKNFVGVKHRIEFVRKVNGVKYYNDSASSTPTRTIEGALNVFYKNIILLAGGYNKNLSYKALGERICETVKTLILIGDTAEKIKISVLCAKKNLKPKIFMVASLREAVEIAAKTVENGDVVLFSPASASFDSFKNFEERGELFKELVNKI
jgi:UDP-N-acetylmuramoylalanine--D-glutamate ligase